MHQHRPHNGFEYDVPLPIKVVVDITPTPTPSMCFTLWAMLERFMSISNIVKPVNLGFVCEQSSTDRMDGSISPSFIVESTFLIEEIEEIHVCLRTPEVEISYFEI